MSPFTSSTDVLFDVSPVLGQYISPYCSVYVNFGQFVSMSLPGRSRDQCRAVLSQYWSPLMSGSVGRFLVI